MDRGKTYRARHTRASLALVACLSAFAQDTREHRRLPEQVPTGDRFQLSLGTLFVPPSLKRKSLPLLVHFHGAPWIAELAAARLGMAAITIHIGVGSAAYAKPFTQPDRFGALLDEAAQKVGPALRPLTLSSWSAGYGAIREILKQPAYFDRISGVILADSVHAGYAAPARLVEADLAPFLPLVRDAAQGRKRVLITHSEIVPGSYASTTETADYLLGSLGLRRRPVRKRGPVGMRQISEARQDGFRVLGYAGDSAPDHVDHFHALPEFLRMLR